MIKKMFDLVSFILLFVLYSCGDHPTKINYEKIFKNSEYVILNINNPLLQDSLSSAIENYDEFYTRYERIAKKCDLDSVKVEKFLWKDQFLPKRLFACSFKATYNCGTYVYGFTYKIKSDTFNLIAITLRPDLDI